MKNTYQFIQITELDGKEQFRGWARIYPDQRQRPNQCESIRFNKRSQSTIKPH